MSEQILGGEIGTERATTRLICPVCEKSFKNEGSLQSHIYRQHNPERPKQEKQRATSGGSKGAEMNRLRRELKKDVSAVTLIPFMLKGTAGNLTDGRITAIIEEKAEGFADAWVAVAEQNDFVRQNLTRLMSGGIWLHAAAQTAALGYVVAVFSGFAPMHPGALMLLPEMQQFTFQQAPPPGANGGGPAEEHGGDQVA